MTIYHRSPAYLQRGQSHPTSSRLVRDKEHNWKSNIPIVFHFQKLIYLSMQSDKGLFPSVLFFYLLTSLGLSGQDGGVHCGKREAHTLIDYIALRCSTFPCIAIHCYPLPCTIAIYNAIYIAIYFAISCSYTLRHIVHLFEWPLLRLLQDSLQEQWRSYLAIGMRTELPNWSHLTVSDTWVQREKNGRSPSEATWHLQLKFTHVGPCSQATQKN